MFIYLDAPFCENTISNGVMCHEVTGCPLAAPPMSVENQHLSNSNRNTSCDQKKHKNFHQEQSKGRKSTSYDDYRLPMTNKMITNTKQYPQNLEIPVRNSTTSDQRCNFTSNKIPSKQQQYINSYDSSTYDLETSNYREDLGDEEFEDFTYPCDMLNRNHDHELDFKVADNVTEERDNPYSPSVGWYLRDITSDNWWLRLLTLIKDLLDVLLENSAVMLMISNDLGLNIIAAVQSMKNNGHIVGNSSSVTLTSHHNNMRPTQDIYDEIEEDDQYASAVSNIIPSLKTVLLSFYRALNQFTRQNSSGDPFTRVEETALCDAIRYCYENIKFPS